ncbi:MAG: hypothetical protein EXS37_13690 [Opitutus sp.]|nr:hypothetical protein [Opitutus sp.]
MKSRIIWAVVVLAAVAGFYYTTIRPANRSSPGFSRKHPPGRNLPPTPEIPAPPLPTPVISTPTLTPPPLPNLSNTLPPIAVKRDDRKPLRTELPIQDKTTIDFSTGAPVVRSGGKDQQDLERALREMAEATKNAAFPPTKK